MRIANEAASLYSYAMEPRDVSEYLAEIGRRGGKARLKTMTPAERKESAQRAAKASVKARKAKARTRKARQGKAI